MLSKPAFHLYISCVRFEEPLEISKKSNLPIRRSSGIQALGFGEMRASMKRSQSSSIRAEVKHFSRLSQGFTVERCPASVTRLNDRSHRVKLQQASTEHGQLAVSFN